MALKQTKCPVSAEDAQEAFPRFDSANEYVCPTCGRFQISRSASPLVEKSTLENRKRMLESAKRRVVFGDAIPRITTYDA